MGRSVAPIGPPGDTRERLLKDNKAISKEGREEERKKGVNIWPKDTHSQLHSVWFMKISKFLDIAVPLLVYRDAVKGGPQVM